MIVVRRSGRFVFGPLISAAGLAVLLLRLLAAAFVIVQYRLLLREAATLPPLLGIGVAGLLAGALLARTRLRAWVAVGFVVAAPWVLRAVILAGFELWLSLIGERAFEAGLHGVDGPLGAALYTLPLQLDLALYPALPLFYLFGWVSIAVQRRAWGVPFEVGLYAVLLALVFWNEAGEGGRLYDHPGALAGVVAAFVLVEVKLLLLTRGRATRRRAARRVRLRDIAAAAAVVLPLIAVAFAGVLAHHRDQALAHRGGLLQPTMLSFEFADHLSLESEISMSDELVALVRYEGARPETDQNRDLDDAEPSAGSGEAAPDEPGSARRLESALTSEQDDPPIPESGRKLLRRGVLSGYSPRRGFYRDGEREPDPVPRRVEPEGTRYPGPPDEYQRGERLHQELYLVNFEPQALLGFNQPLSARPYTLPAGSSFTAAYAVESSVPAPEAEIREADAPNDPNTVGSDRYEYYTEHGEDERVQALAEEVTAGAESPAEALRLIEEYFHREFHYSLRPGVAPDGNQLHHFLFQERRGYCTYFAHAMTLMSRSLGIPARVAVGFYVVPELELMGFHPIRADMAHAWVEAYLPELGWVEYDPTTAELAPGEDFEAPAPFDSAQLAGLVEEIFSDQLELDRTVDETLRETDPAAGSARARLAAALLVLLLLGYPALVLTPRLALLAALRRAQDPRAEARLQYRRGRGRLRRAGLSPATYESVREYAERVDALGHEFGPLTEQYLAAQFAPRYGMRERERLLDAVRRFERGFRAAVGPARRLAAALRPDSASRLRRSALIALAVPAIGLALALIAAPRLGAEQPEREMSEYAEEAAMAVLQQRYRYAREVLIEGIEQYPDAVRLHLALGDLYFDRGLYRSALDAYRQAEQINPDSYGALDSLAATLARQNRDAEATEYRERFLERYPGRPDAIADLGWLYFKTQRIDEGIALLEEAVEEHPEDRGLWMTFGTLLGAAYEHAEAVEAYERAITIAERQEDRRFASVAYYNLAILERRFERYEESYQSAGESVAAMERATGFIALGELYERRLDRDRAERAYRRAYQLEQDAPLSRLSLARLQFRFGELEQAAAYVRSVREDEDRGWLFRYGTDIDRHRLGVERQLGEIYAALAYARRFTPAASVGEYLELRARELSERVLGFYHELGYRRIAFRIGWALLQTGNSIDGASMLSQATNRHPSTAARFLEIAARHELERNPAAETAYNARKAGFERDAAALRTAVDELDSPWERGRRADGLAVLVELHRRNRENAEAVEAALKLYRLNPAALPGAGIRLPVALEFDSRVEAGVRARLHRALTAAGFRELDDGAGLRLRMRPVSAGVLGYVLEDDREAMRRGTVDYGATRAAAARTAREIAAGVFSSR